MAPSPAARPIIRLERPLPRDARGRTCSRTCSSAFMCSCSPSASVASGRTDTTDCPGGGSAPTVCGVPSGLPSPDWTRAAVSSRPSMTARQRRAAAPAATPAARQRLMAAPRFISTWSDQIAERRLHVLGTLFLETLEALFLETRASRRRACSRRRCAPLADERAPGAAVPAAPHAAVLGGSAAGTSETREASPTGTLHVEPQVPRRGHRRFWPSCQLRSSGPCTHRRSLLLRHLLPLLRRRRSLLRRRAAAARSSPPETARPGALSGARAPPSARRASATREPRPPPPAARPPPNAPPPTEARARVRAQAPPRAPPARRWRRRSRLDRRLLRVRHRRLDRRGGRRWVCRPGTPPLREALPHLHHAPVAGRAVH